MLFSPNELSGLLTKRINGVIHAGAHRAEELLFYKSIDVPKTIWIEANPHLATNLFLNLSSIEGQTVFFAAAHEVDFSTVTLHIANNGESSSVLKLKEHEIEHPHIHYIEDVIVPTRRIDSIVINGGFDSEQFNFMNVDVQGLELLVLKGSTNILNSIDYIYSEVNEKYLYEDCALISDLDSYLIQYGFSRIQTKMTQHGWGDALYCKNL